MNNPLFNFFRTSKVFAIVLGLHLFVLSLLLFHPGCQRSGYSSEGAPMGEVTALDNAALVEPTRPTDADMASDVNEVAVDQSVVSTDIAPVEPTVSAYTVQKGDSLWNIARKNGITVDELLKANNLTKSSVIRPGQELKLPAPVAAAVSTPVETQAAVATSGSYKVQSGDTLGKIAKRNGVSVRDLKAANGLSSDMIRVGQELKLPAAGATATPSVEAPAATEAAPAEVSAPTADEEGVITHTVSRGETPAKIAKKYGVKTNELLSMNGISDPRKLRVGQKLKVKPSLPASAETTAPAADSASTTVPPSIEALDAMVDSAAEAPVIEVAPAATKE